MARWFATAFVLLGLLAGAWGELSRIRAWSLRERAEDAYYGEDFHAALNAYERVIGRLPGDPRSYTDPADTISQVIEGPKGRELALAEIESLAVRATGYYLEAIRVSPPNAWAYAGLGALASALRIRRQQAASIDLASLSRDPLENLRPADRLHEAALVKAVQIEPRNYYYRDFLGDFYWRRGFRDRALEHFRIAARLQPVLDRHYYLSYLVSVSPEVLTAVEEGIREALLSPDTEVRPEEIHRFLAAVYAQLGRYDDARACLETAAETTRHPHLIDIKIGRMLNANGDLEEAAEAFRRSADRRPDYYRSWMHLGETLSRLGRHDEAIEALERARGLRPADYQPSWALAKALEEAGRLEEATDVLEIVIRSHPTRHDPFLRLISIFESQDRIGEAVGVARRLAAQNPTEEVFQTQVEQLEAKLQ